MNVRLFMNFQMHNEFMNKLIAIVSVFGRHGYKSLRCRCCCCYSLVPIHCATHLPMPEPRIVAMTAEAAELGCRCLVRYGSWLKALTDGRTLL